MENKRIVTGVRPTGSLSIGNYLGAIKPIIELQESHDEIFLFVADLHALTDNDPSVFKYNVNLIATYIALGINPEKVIIYRQSDIAEQIALLTLMLAKYVSAAELMRLPSLKEKMKGAKDVTTANSLLLLYPVMMSADILIIRANIVPVGQDQVSHIEIARKIARRFNNKVSDIFPVPQTFTMEPIRVLSLKGDGKMSKSNPNGAIFLDDSEKIIEQKVKHAQTANEGEGSPHLESMRITVRGIGNKQDNDQLNELIESHISGQKVTARIKDLFGEVVLRFVKEYQEKRSTLTDKYIQEVVTVGAIKAHEEAIKTISLLKASLGM